MAHRFVAYIDESGDEGFHFPEHKPESSSSKWFVISAVITPATRDKYVIELARSIRAKLQMQPKALLHFSSLPHEKRVYVINRIATSWLTVTSVIIHKERIEQREIFRAGAFRLYKYAARLLLERISWFCRDTAAANDCECRLIFEHRARLSYDDLRDYLTILQDSKARPKKMLGWKCFSMTFTFIGLRLFHKTSKPRRTRNTPVYNWPTVSQAEREPLWNIATVSLSIVMRKHLNQESTSGVRTIRVMDSSSSLTVLSPQMTEAIGFESISNKKKGRPPARDRMGFRPSGTRRLSAEPLYSRFRVLNQGVN